MPLFFTLSGFIIHYVYADAFATGGCGAPLENLPLRGSRGFILCICCCLSGRYCAGRWVHPS